MGGTDRRIPLASIAVAIGMVLTSLAPAAAAATPVTATGIIRFPPGGACAIFGGVPFAYAEMTVDVDTGAGALLVVGGCFPVPVYHEVWPAGACTGTRTGDISCPRAFLRADGYLFAYSMSGSVVRVNSPVDDPTGA